MLFRSLLTPLYTTIKCEILFCLQVLRMSSLTSEDSNMGNKQSSLSADSDSGAECRQISTDCLPEVIEPEPADPVSVVPPSRVKQEPCERRQTSDSEDALQQTLEVNIDIHLTGSPEASVLSDAEDVQDDSVIVLVPARHRALRSSGHQEPRENSEEQAMREKQDRKSTRLNSSHPSRSRMPSSA